MINAYQYHEVIRLTEDAKQAGFNIVRSQWDPDCLALALDGNSYSCYDRDSQVLQGNSDHIQGFLDGLRFIRRYYTILGLVDDKKVARAEQDEKNRQLVELLAKGSGKPA